MEFLFVSVYDFFHKRPRVLAAVFLILLLICGYGASRIEIRENVSEIFPDAQEGKEINQILQSRALEKLVFMVSFKDTSRVDPDSLIAMADSLVTNIRVKSEGYISEINFRVDDKQAHEIFSIIIEHLPVFLEDEDYLKLDSILTPERLPSRIQENYRNLISPSGIITKRLYSKDIIGISQLALSKIQQLQYDDNYVLYDNAVFTRDRKHVLFFITPRYPANDTGNNIELIDALDASIATITQQYATAEIVYFGGTAVAVGNARQIRQDTWLTLSLMLALLAVFVIWFFKKKRAPLVILIPVAFGALFSIACIALLKGHVSVLALAAGSIILGIAVNYSLHLIVHIQHAGNMRETIKDLASPMTLGSATTVMAFLGLQFANASVLRDIGLFAAFSLIGAAMCTLVFLPHFFKTGLFEARPRAEEYLKRFLTFGSSGRKWIVVSIFLLTPVFLYVAGDVVFNSDMNRLNYMGKQLQLGEQRLNAINEFSRQSAYIIATGDNVQEALQTSERIQPVLRRAEKAGVADKYVSVSTLLISDSLQAIRIARWNAYWSEHRKSDVLAMLKTEGAGLNFSPAVYTAFTELTSNKYASMDNEASLIIRNTFFKDYFLEATGKAVIVTPVMVQREQKEEFYTEVERIPSAEVVDRRTVINNFIEYVNDDFTFIVTFTSLIVFASLLIAYGRIELALITFTPMLITWIWILGLMALLGIEFNIVNVMISTFIFGLGDDYSIFTMDGLQQEYKTGKKMLGSVRISVFISAFTTIVGLGVLIFAKHPALQSIALISIIGIGCVFVMSQTVEPFLFDLFVSSRARRKVSPVTFWSLCKTVFAFSFFAFGSLFLAGIGFILFKVIPFQRKRLRYFYHMLLRLFAYSIIYVMGNLKKRVINREGVFDKPSVIICNHASFLDILLTTMLSPRVILLTNKWVWNSPVFGLAVRFAEYYPVTEGAEESIERLRKKVAEGFSIVVFPEGTRSPDGKVKRFHKGAFFIAEKLNLDVTPLLIHGTWDTIEKGDFYLHDSTMTLKFLPAIKPTDVQFGENYSARTKTISKYFKQELAKLADEIETPEYFRYKLLRNYYYKGPVLEWYAKIKLSLEDNYRIFDELIPDDATVLDLGCGYGFLCYMLGFTSRDRQITGIDYDEEKILTASHCYAKTDRMNFIHADITAINLSPHDVIVLSDVLHYLQPQQQQEILHKAFSALKPGGKIILRDANAELKNRHRGAVITEFFSTKVLRFNKANQQLSFLKAETVIREAAAFNRTVEILDNTKFTSNVIFVIK